MSKIKILIVEDEIIAARSYSIALRQYGYEICTLASSGEKGIEVAERERPDIVLMDIGLKGRMNGIEAADDIRQKLGTPIIFITGYYDEDIKEKVGVTQADQYLVKPIQGIDLKNAIESVLQE